MEPAWVEGSRWLVAGPLAAVPFLVAGGEIWATVPKLWSSGAVEGEVYCIGPSKEVAKELAYAGSQYQQTT